jgi:undecaprenyl-diphosphatase
MIESLLSLDREVFLYLNNLGSEPYDGLWKFITKQINWLPFFLILAWLIQKSVGWKRLFIAMAILGLMMVFTDKSCQIRCPTNTALQQSGIGRVDAGSDFAKIL